MVLNLTTCRTVCKVTGHGRATSGSSQFGTRTTLRRFAKIQRGRDEMTITVRTQTKTFVHAADRFEVDHSHRSLLQIYEKDKPLAAYNDWLSVSEGEVLEHNQKREN